MERSNAVRDLQKLHTKNNNMQGVSERNTERNFIGSIRPQPTTPTGQRDTVRTGRGQSTVLPTQRQEQTKSVNTQADFTESANFMPETDNTESGDVGFSSPSDQEIYRESTDREKYDAMFGKRKDAKQRHILDVAKKLDSDLKVVFVDPDNKMLSGRAGVFMPDTKTIYLSNDNSVVGMYCQLFKHEFVHRLELKKAYQSFKNYLFRNSSVFERYVRARLKKINGTEFDGTREEALKALSSYYLNLVRNGDFPAQYKRSFTVEYAEREMVADFVGEVLFKGKKNYDDIAQNLADSELGEVLKLEDTFAEFENLNETERGWFRRMIDTIKDFISSLKGVKQNKRLVEDLEYIEKRLARVLDSKDTKKAASKAVDRQYCLRETTPNDFNPNGVSLNEQLQDAYETSNSFDQRYVYVGKFSKSFIELLKENKITLHDYPIAMNYRDAYLSMRNKETGKYHGEGINYHNLGVEGLQEALESFKNPKHIMKSKKDGKIELALQTVDKNGNNVLSIIAINTITLNGNKMLDAHIVTSAYGKRNIENYILTARNEGRIIEPKKEELSQGTPQVQYKGSINDNSSNDIILNKEDSVKNNISKERLNEN